MAEILRQGHRRVPLIVTGFGVTGPAQIQQCCQHFDLAVGRRGVDGGAAICGTLKEEERKWNKRKEKERRGKKKKEEERRRNKNKEE